MQSSQLFCRRNQTKHLSYNELCGRTTKPRRLCHVQFNRQFTKKSVGTSPVENNEVQNIHVHVCT